ncbi:MAG: HlyD family efflux transporter periplasmic adaptor subunit [Peptococcaceae bacterium]|nr:HlyD family efflux transporter periplasmic adaptor subunit [Peptococcaceae bacterium]
MKEYKLQELTDSALLYDRNPPKLLLYIVLMVVGLLALVTYLLIITEKTYVVTCEGLVQAVNKQNITSRFSGELMQSYMEEGQTVREGDLLAVIRGSDLKQLTEQIEATSNRITLLERLEEDLIQGRNSFSTQISAELEFYNRYQAVMAQKASLDRSNESLEREGYSREKIEEIKATIEIQKRQIQYNVLSEISKEKSQLIEEKNRMDAQEEYKLYAAGNGVVHLTVQVYKGMMLQAGIVIGSISDPEDELYLETYISAADRPRVSLNDEVDVVIQGLLQSEYGILKGELAELDTDATLNPERGTVLFKAKVTPLQAQLTNRKGDVADLSLGMTAEIRIKYSKITYFQYLMDGLGIQW